RVVCFVLRSWPLPLYPAVAAHPSRVFECGRRRAAMELGRPDGPGTHVAEDDSCTRSGLENYGLEVWRGHVGIERIDRSVEPSVSEPRDVLVDAAGREGEEPAL